VVFISEVTFKQADADWLRR